MILDIPEKIRVISLLPIGVPAYSIEKERKRLEEICHVAIIVAARQGWEKKDQGNKIKMEATRHGMRAHFPPRQPE